MKAPFKDWQSGLQTLDTFEAMCRAHDMTYSYADDMSVWRKGHEEMTLISEAAIQLGTDARTVWNKVVRERLHPTHARDFLW